MKSLGTIPFLVFTLSVACVSFASGAGRKDVAWIANPYDGYSEKEYVAATGSGTTTGDADKNATAELCRILSQSIETHESLKQTDSSKKGSQLSTYLSTVTTHTSLTSISGLTIKDRFTNGKGTSYSRAVLNRAEAGRHYSLLFNQKDEEVETLVTHARQAGVSFTSCALLTKAYKIAQENDGYMQLLSVLNRSYYKQPSYGSSAEVGQLAQNAFNAVTVNIEVTGDVDGRVAAVFSSAINDTGIGTATGNKDAPYQMTCTVSFEDAGQNGSAYYVRYVVTSSLKETATGTEVLNFSSNGRQGKLSKEEAQQGAVRIIETKVKNEFTSKFTSLFDSLAAN